MAHGASSLRKYTAAWVLNSVISGTQLQNTIYITDRVR